MPGIIDRIAAEAGVPDLVEILSHRLSPSDLQSLLMHVFKRRSAGSGESEILQRAVRMPMLAASTVDARHLNDFDRAAFEAAQGFDAVELSLAGPLGLNRVLGKIDQDHVLTTIRNAEVAGDPTTMLAIESSRRRKTPARRKETLRLCASQRVMRLQPFDVPGFTPHFRLFCLVSSGRDRGSGYFEIEELARHIEVLLRLFRALNSRGFSFVNPLIEVSDLDIVRRALEAHGLPPDEVRKSVRAHTGGSESFLAAHGIEVPEGADIDGRLAHLKRQTIDPLLARFPEAGFRFNFSRLEGVGYYKDLCFRISPIAPDGQRYPIVDGGFTDWTARLLGDRKERFLTTGIGAEFACRRYRVPAG